MKNYKKILTEKITKASRIAFKKIIAEKPNERFFTFVLLTLDDALCCYAYANSYESHQRTIQKNDIAPNSKDEEYYKWSPVEWEYAHIMPEEFNEVYDYSEKIQNELSDDYNQFKSDFIECMENVLIQLDKENLFGNGEQRNEITLFLTVADSFLTEEVEEQSGKKLNSPIVFEKFAKRFSLHQQEEQRIQNEKNNIKNNISKYSEANQINYWINELDKIANDERSDVRDASFDFKNEFVLDCLIDIGKNSVVPLLIYLNDSFKSEDTNHTYDSLRFDILKSIPRMENKSKEVHQKLRMLFNLWLNSNMEGTTGFHLSNTLYILFKGYPEPDFYEEKYENFIKEFKKNKT